MTKISKGLGLTPKINDTRFANLIISLTGHKFDVIASALYITPLSMLRGKSGPRSHINHSIAGGISSSWRRWWQHQRSRRLASLLPPSSRHS